MTDADAQVIAEGARAEAALDYLAPYFNALRSEAMGRWLASGLDQAQLREKLFMAVRALNSTEAAIRSMIEQAQAAEVMAEHPNMKVWAENALAAEGLTRP